MTKILFLLFVFCCFLFVSKRMLRYLRYLQQDAYDLRRFLHWYWRQKAFDQRGTCTLLVTALLYTFIPDVSYILGSIIFLGWYFWEEDPRTSGKLKLKMTDRAKRIYFLSLGFYLVLQILLMAAVDLFWGSQIILLQMIPFLLMGAVAILSIDEKRRQSQLLKEAKDKLVNVSPFVIGITGSYGKTSTKDALSNILQVTLGSTFWPSKGINTPMGITREIREKLKKGMKYAVIEMAAYEKGSIKRLCDLCPPHAGIITTIGVAHLSRFGSSDTIREAKSELAQAIPSDGILVCNGDNPGTRRIAQENPKKTVLLYGFDNSKSDLDCWIKEYSLVSGGVSFEIKWKGKVYRGKTALMGRAAISNLAAAFAMSCALGADPEFVIAACSLLKPVDNRLQVSQESGITYIRDAYNSNPDGFIDALEVLNQLKGNKKVLMTPGMIELADLEKDLHDKIGRRAGQICNLAIIVGGTNRDSLTSGLVSGGMDRTSIIHVDSRDEALKTLSAKINPGDVVLIENDLPDLYEAKERF